MRTAIIEERETTTSHPAGLGRRRSTKSAVSWLRRADHHDGVELEILWSNLIGIVDERAKALQRIAFSRSCAKAGDLAVALFDRRGRMVAQPTPARPATQLAGDRRRPLVGRVRQPHRPGDVLITNDPWLSARAFLDIHRVTRIFDATESSPNRLDHPPTPTSALWHRRRRAPTCTRRLVDPAAQLYERASPVRSCTR